MLSDKIIHWYLANKRDLPWRNTTDPYWIWLSEIMLQQTRVDQGLNYFLRFTEAFPHIENLAQADESRVLRLWQGLGYYSRARNLHKTAKIVSEQYNGNFPKEYEEIKKLPGIGNYTAAAVASIAFKKPHAVVDGNVYRVLSRLFTIDTAIDTGRGKKEFEELANALIDKKKPDLFNQGLMEIGALICKPKNPDCPNCPLQTECLAFKAGTMLEYPTKSRKQQVRNRYFHYLFIACGEQFYMQKRTEKGIWQNLYEFYLIETQEPQQNLDKLEEAFPDWLKATKTRTVGGVKTYTHLLSHQKIHAQFWHLIVDQKPSALSQNFFSDQELEQLPKHKLIVQYLSDRSIRGN
ncbi:A/G-specific adenine glycosylase [Marinilongibacter aquaticus]|uniref:A/G-specific adenine glycosylase n=1 Tax=Marinilongibacter aquaticus TaxID=2975157 RepID=UPI0021BD713C|nr:A/G-specific adenine glycosylase [Marinilongibacter aquaticus]UBM60524.1 A/G-specific adenine glycosylase [Marinilongibacter aquaticus]